MQREIIQTREAPGAIGTYSQAVKVGGLLFVSGQIALHPVTGTLCQDTFDQEVEQVFANLEAIAKAAGTSLEQAVKVNLYLLDMGHFAKVNEIMARFFQQPYPARAAVAVAQLPRGARFEAEAVILVP